LWVGQHQLGLLWLESELIHIFVESEIRPITALAQQMAIAIENRRLYDQQQRDAEREGTINRITSRLRNALSVEQVLNIATQEVRAATRASISVAEIAPTARPAGGQPQSDNGHAPESEA
jgi:GAF domain-containing protein